MLEAISAAHARGIRVHAWLDVNLASGVSEFPASRDHVIYQHPEWLMVPRELAADLVAVDVRSPEYLGRLARWTRANAQRLEGLYISPLHGGVHVQLAATIKDVVTRYPVDGVHLDHVRFPGADFDYSRAAMSAFRAEVRARLTAAERARIDAVAVSNPFAYAEELGDEWRLFRQTQVTALVTRLRSTAKAVRPDVVVSATVVPESGGRRARRVPGLAHVGRQRVHRRALPDVGQRTATDLCDTHRRRSRAGRIQAGVDPQLRFAGARDLLQLAIARHAFPAAAVEVGDTTAPLWQEAFGRLTFSADAPPTSDNTIFDLASLTKVLSTTPLVMQQVERGALALDDPVARHLDTWRGDDRSAVTVRDLLTHASGLPAWLPFFREHRGREAFERAIAATPLEYPRRSQSIYSDLGFMLLGFMLERDLPLAARFATLFAQMGIVQEVQFNPPALWRGRTAPTELDAWRGRLLVGEVHDENAHALGGVAGHAGLFGTAAAVGDYARHLLQILDGRTGAFRRETLATFITRDPGVPGSSRALGWDTMLPTSSCGTRMSPRAFGHTGFTGTSLWIDPDRGVYVVFLTNRVHPTRDNDAIKQVRPALHDAVMVALD